MQDELTSLGLPVDVDIVGVNESGLEAGNPSITAGRDLPWLQDTLATLVWKSWNVTFRDVILLDEENFPIAVYNLTDHDLSDPEKYQALKKLFTDAATPGP
ncbi:MAG: hypothetical protein EXR75_08750 [Myxococcales bacterium]|nr:hypothetical protein [Myxococcales bacterium]